MTCLEFVIRCASLDLDEDVYWWRQEDRSWRSFAECTRYPSRVAAEEVAICLMPIRSNVGFSIHTVLAYCHVMEEGLSCPGTTKDIISKINKITWKQKIEQRLSKLEQCILEKQQKSDDCYVICAESAQDNRRWYWGQIGWEDDLGNPLVIRHHSEAILMDLVKTCLKSHPSGVTYVKSVTD